MAPVRALRLPWPSDSSLGRITLSTLPSVLPRCSCTLRMLHGLPGDDDDDDDDDDGGGGGGGDKSAA